MLKIVPIPAFTDNYIWAIHSPQGKVVIVDPGAAEPTENYLAEKRASLAAILLTHHHQDHIGGVASLLQNHPSIPVFGPGSISIVTAPVKAGDLVKIPELSSPFQVFETPGHTLDHLVYYNNPHLFCGDTLFAGGCGRLFEGTPENMYNSLTLLAQLPKATTIYCAHEYTEANLRFAAAVEPGNQQITARQAKVGQQRKESTPTIPSLLDEELQTNPFLRCHMAAVQQAASTKVGHPLTSAVDVFAVVRHWKDNF